jgi:recombinational DNA repair ATPase RecF
MYIKEVSIDGFKSYAQRVTLSNFDPGFNAITGLNGSGKSNILDAICFVMGIKNLSAVRALLNACAHQKRCCPIAASPQSRSSHFQL